MNYPKRAHKSKKTSPEGDRGEDRSELKLAEYSAPHGEEMPWRTGTCDWLELADARHEWRPELGRLH